MSLAGTLLELAANAALGIWLGSIVFFSFVGAPTTFAVLDREHAGTVVNAIFPRYYLFGIGLGLVALVAAVGRGVLGAGGAPLLGMLGAIGFGMSANGYARWVLIPKMEAAGEEGFERYHRQSVLLNGATLVAVAGALVASHL